MAGRECVKINEIDKILPLRSCSASSASLAAPQQPLPYQSTVPLDVDQRFQGGEVIHDLCKDNTAKFQAFDRAEPHREWSKDTGTMLCVQSQMYYMIKCRSHLYIYVTIKIELFKVLCVSVLFSAHYRSERIVFCQQCTWVMATW